MPDFRQFTCLPPFRCGFATGDPLRPLCGELAWWMRSTDPQLEVRYFCGKHRDETDVEIAGDVFARRLTLRVDVLFTGVTLRDTTARAEALARLESAIAALGGLLNLHGVESEVGRFTVQPGPGPKRALRGRG